MHRRSFLASLFAPLIPALVCRSAGASITPRSDALLAKALDDAKKAADSLAQSLEKDFALVRSGMMSRNECRRLSEIEVARIFGVPPHLLMQSESATYGAAWEASHPTLRSPV